MGIEAIRSATAVDLGPLAQSQSTSANTSTSKSDQSSTKKAAGAPPAGSGAGVKAAESSSSTSSSSSVKIYEAADTNKDGVVSYQEELLYSLTHPANETQNQASSPASQLQTGLKSYQQDQQANVSSQGSLISSI